MDRGQIMLYDDVGREPCLRHFFGELRADVTAPVHFVLRQKAGEWRAIHYAESPEASLIQLRRAHEDAVDPRLHERLAAKGVRY
jgi:hypothetical protein|tara:strand:+ start:47485 stop:47736 length:252 start_codon:yes stop_codon:yes gene_type:complete